MYKINQLINYIRKYKIINIGNIIFKIFIIMFFMILLFSCNNNKISENIIFTIEDIDKTNNNQLILINTDYKIMKYIENNELEIEIKNSKIIIELNNLINPDNLKDLVYYNPIIYIKIKGKEYVAKGMWVFSSAIPQNCDFIYLLDVDGKIWFIDNNKITFKKWGN
jgi:hypothetical protein